MDLPITIKPLTPDLRDEYFDFFDHMAFTDNPGWASCYCFFPHAPHDSENWDERTGAQNRQSVREIIAAGIQRGYLAFSGDRAVGWCNAGLRATFTILDFPEEPGTPPMGSIVCFLVAPDYRGQGVATRLLKTVCEGFRSEGITVVEAYPRPETTDAAQNHPGPLGMYLAAGFVRVGERGRVTIVRKQLE